MKPARLPGRSWISLLAAATALTVVPATANAAVIILEGVTEEAGVFRFSYQGTLGPDEGVQNGDRLIIFDFAGFVPGSFITPATVVGSTELTSATPFIIPGQTDDPTIENLVFTYTGPGFQTSGGPFAPFNFDGLSALSTLGGTRLDAFTTFTLKNNPPAETGLPVVTLGTTEVPAELTAAVPEPSTWAMLLFGFGGIGFALRRRKSTGPATRLRISYR
jgi:hypothetical protein